MLSTTHARWRIPAKWSAHHRHLTQLRELVRLRQQDLVQDALEERPTFSTHQADAATDAFDRDLALGMLSSEQDALNEIDQALHRIRTGAYGRCELTGKPIEAARLKAIPWTRFSAAAEKQLERSGELNHARLGPRQSLAVPEAPRKASASGRQG